jgi:hypothetical protein
VIGATISNMAAAGAERECLLGNRVPKATSVEEVRVAANATLLDYVRHAGTRVAADASPAFTAKAKRRSWTAAGKAGDVRAVDDPTARRIVAGEAVLAPDAFVRASDGRSALGLWRVSDKDQAVAPTALYWATFRQEKAGWKIVSLELVSGEQTLQPVTQYCHIPGDVELFKADVAEWEAKKAAKAARKAAARAAREQR